MSEYIIPAIFFIVSIVLLAFAIAVDAFANRKKYRNRSK